MASGFERATRSVPQLEYGDVGWETDGGSATGSAVLAILRRSVGHMPAIVRISLVLVAVPGALIDQWGVFSVPNTT